MLGQIQVRKEIAERLKQARIAAGYVSAEEFSEKNNLSIKEYLLHEEGIVVIRASHALHYCSLLNVSIQWLMLGKVWEEMQNKA